MYTQADTTYAHRAWNTPAGGRMAAALAAWGMTHSQVAQVRPPIARMGLFPPRVGYGERVAFSIDDVARLDERYPGARIDYGDQSSGPGYSGTAMPAMNVM